ncbi:TonB-dependent receptor [Sphingomonas sp. SUN019]|uniref:TonB-dependent receptor n=1 Tax=Sphingomonas sp. SUN019 TaxID=2937788 RepID=UPI0021649F77|nr:TonB-dependent receptor [Sphingomonas sp. SUN019]UVO50685.1 TonB-dependent receptor [Sphingomonas sp. SUN019]
MRYSRTLLGGGSLAALLIAAPLHAQTAASERTPTAAEAQAETPSDDKGGLSDIVVTATKRGQAQNVQDVPIAITAFGSDQLDALHARSIASLSYNVPNASLESVGTTPGYANFSIRGLGINSSIPSIDPTVGVFVDGVYLGVSAGVLFDTFDLAGVEVLRGPQGLLFGRNVTGGAVVLRTTTPSNVFHVDAKAGLSTGLEKRASISVSGPVIEDKLSAKLAVYYNDDAGWFRNDFDGRKIGGSETLIVRPALRFTPADDFELILRYEHGRIRGDGPASTNHGLFPRDSFRVNQNFRGFIRSDWDQGIAEVNVDVAFGDGKITNIAAVRALSNDAATDVDASPVTALHSRNNTEQWQFSNELRYAGTFGRFDVTSGLFYFDQDIKYAESRLLSGGALLVSGGGRQEQDTIGIFTTVDWRVLDTVTLSVGARYSTESKAVQVRSIGVGGCNLDTINCSYNFSDSKRWNGFTPRVGVQYKPTDDTMLYASFSQGFRSGGYNFRNLNPNVAPGPFDQERQDAYELGLKQQFGRVARINVAGFYNKIDGTQREFQAPFPPFGNFQVITNAADVSIKGLEGELTLTPVRGLTISAQVGYTDGQYDKILFDLNADGVIDDRDFRLKLPRLSPWSYGGSIAYETRVTDDVSADARVGANHRDAAFYNDQNTGLLNAATMVDASIGVSRGAMRLSVYGANLLNEATFGTEAPLPFFPGSTFSPLSKGRVYGVEVGYKF